MRNWIALAAMMLAAGGLCRAGETLSLDGAWEIVFDPGNAGREGKWHLDEVFSAHPGRRQIRVPSCWEEIEKDYEGVAFYRRKFRVPAAWQGKRVRLRFDAVNFMAEVWLNDHAVGVHEGGFTPFEFRVEQMLHFGEENTLTVRVAGPILLKDKIIEGVGPMETPQWRGAIAGGIWQPVRLIATGEAYVKDVFLEPRIRDDTVTFHVQIEHTGASRQTAGVEFRVREVSRGEEVVAEWKREVTLTPGRNRLKQTLKIPEAVYWSPENPHLYWAEVRVIARGEQQDSWSARFGLREFTVRNGRFYLNGKPYALKAVFFEGLYPVRLAYPDSREMVEREIRLAKKAGFNMIRPWRKPPPPVWLDAADELGVMTVGSMAIECMRLPLESARLPGWVENEIRETILRDRNRTCVVEWELFNELVRPVLKQLLHPMAMLARRLDPTRLIVDESGGWAQGANLYLPYRSVPMKYNDVHYYPGPQINDQVYRKLRMIGEPEDEQRAAGIRGRLPGRNVIPGLPVYVSELGYGSLPNLPAINQQFTEEGNPIVPPTLYHRRLARQLKQALWESGFHRIYPDLERFCLDQQRIHGRANKRMIEAVRTNPNVIGYCVHALTAGDWIIGAGLLDLFRNPKGYAYEATREANRPRILSIRVVPRNVYAGRGATLEITAVNDLEPVEGVMEVRISPQRGGPVFERRLAVEMPGRIRQLLTAELDTRRWRGTYIVTASMRDGGGRLVAENRYEFDVFSPEDLAPPEHEVAVLDPDNRLKPFLRKAGVRFSEFSQGGAGPPVLVSRIVPKTDAEKARLQRLLDEVAAGRTAVYVNGVRPTPGSMFAPKTVKLDAMPAPFRVQIARGLWTCEPHIVSDHPIFEGLPVNGMMGPIYENVWTRESLLDLSGEVIAGSIGFYYHPGSLRRRHYYGPGDVWWGADVIRLRHGRGAIIVSQLRLLENLGKDPVADKILFNLIRYVTE